MAILKKLHDILNPLQFATKQLSKESVDLFKAEDIVTFMISSLIKVAAPSQFIENLKTRVNERRNKTIVSVLSFFSQKHNRSPYFENPHEFL